MRAAGLRGITRSRGDKGVHYVAVRCTQRLAEAGAVASVGSTGDSCGKALAEAFNSPFEAELIRDKGPWRSIDDLEIAVAEFEDACCRDHTASATAEAAPQSLC